MGRRQLSEFTCCFFFFSSRRRHTRLVSDWSSDVCSSDLRDLHGQLRDRELDLAKQQELLAHDQDIRELMGARDLYIAEVYDVARDGQTRSEERRVGKEGRSRWSPYH